MEPCKGDDAPLNLLPKQVKNVVKKLSPIYSKTTNS